MAAQLNNIMEQYSDMLNFVGGKPSNLSGQFFEVRSEFHPEFITRVANSNIFETRMALSRANNTFEECQQLGFEKRRDILREASKKLFLGSMEEEYVVKMTGMPLKSVRAYLKDVPGILINVPRLIEDRIGMHQGRIGRHPIEGDDMFKFLEPVEGICYAVTPGNDPRTVPFVASWLVSLGIPTIFKVSKNDMAVSVRVIKAIIDAGYPRGGLSVLCWDTSDVSRNAMHFKLVDAARVLWVFGDDNTVNSKLRFEVSREGGVEKVVDHFSDKIILKHASGRAAGVVDSDVDLKKATESIITSAMHWPIGCNSMKAVFTVKDIHEDVLDKLTSEFSKLKVGDPLDKGVDVGYIAPSELSKVNLRIKLLGQMGLLHLRHGKVLSEHQTTPLLAVTDDINSEFISKEYPAYLLTVKAARTYDEAIDQLNATSLGAKRLAVSFYSNDMENTMRTRIRAHHVKLWKPTTELDILFHEGNDYLHKLTEPQIHRRLNLKG